MRRASTRAKGYVNGLPADHFALPFLVVVSLGHAIERHADVSGHGCYDTQIPGCRGFRISIAAPVDPAMRARLNAVRTDPGPHSPAAPASVVTRQIAERPGSRPATQRRMSRHV